MPATSGTHLPEGFSLVRANPQSGPASHHYIEGQTF